MVPKGNSEGKQGSLSTNAFTGPGYVKIRTSLWLPVTSLQQGRILVLPKIKFKFKFWC